MRPLNPSGGDLAKLRSDMFRAENIYQEAGVVKAPPGQSLKMADGTIGQTNRLKPHPSPTPEGIIPGLGGPVEGWQSAFEHALVSSMN